MTFSGLQKQNTDINAITSTMTVCFWKKGLTQNTLYCAWDRRL